MLNFSGVNDTFPLKHSGYASCAISVKKGREVVVTGGDAVGGIAHHFVDRLNMYREWFEKLCFVFSYFDWIDQRRCLFVCMFVICCVCPVNICLLSFITPKQLKYVRSI